jgi:hypothetical protein
MKIPFASILVIDQHRDGLVPELREQRCRYTSEMIAVLTAMALDNWAYFVTEDQSWFFLTYFPCRMSTLTRFEVAAKSKNDIHTKKFKFPVM